MICPVLTMKRSQSPFPVKLEAVDRSVPACAADPIAARRRFGWFWRKRSAPVDLETLTSSREAFSKEGGSAIQVGIRSSFFETTEARWIRRILVILVLLCFALAVFVWSELLSGGSP